MATTFNDIIINRCLVMIDDFKITQHWGEGTLDPYLDGFMRVAISRFKPYCDNLECDYLARSFTNDLAESEIDILSYYWIIAWARREVNNASQLQLKLKTPSGFTFSSEGSTLKAKMTWIDSLEEEASRMLTAYQLSEGCFLNYNW